MKSPALQRRAVVESLQPLENMEGTSAKRRIVPLDLEKCPIIEEIIKFPELYLEYLYGLGDIYEILNAHDLDGVTEDAKNFLFKARAVVQELRVQLLIDPPLAIRPTDN